MDKRILTQNGEFDYDYQNDILFFKVVNRDYSHSIELKNIVIDIDEEDLIVGIQIFQASKFFNMPKEFIRSIKNWKFEANVEANTVELRLAFNVMYRNKLIEKNPILIQPLNEDVPDSKLICTC